VVPLGGTRPACPQGRCTYFYPAFEGLAYFKHKGQPAVAFTAMSMATQALMACLCPRRGLVCSRRSVATAPCVCTQSRSPRLTTAVRALQRDPLHDRVLAKNARRLLFQSHPRGYLRNE
jgi:hypothetical protein